MNYNDLSNKELLETYDNMSYYDDDLNKVICDRAGLADEYRNADGETFEAVLDSAISILEKE